MKIVINADYGGFGLSRKAVDRLVELGSIETLACLQKLAIEYNNWSEDERRDSFSFEYDTFYMSEVDGMERHDPLLVKVVEELGTEASGEYASLHVIEIPDDVEYEINEYDGYEHVAEVHRRWYYHEEGGE